MGEYEIHLALEGQLRLQLSLRDRLPFGVAGNPALKRWAILDGPIRGQEAEFLWSLPPKMRNIKT